MLAEQNARMEGFEMPVWPACVSRSCCVICVVAVFSKVGWKGPRRGLGPCNQPSSVDKRGRMR